MVVFKDSATKEQIKKYERKVESQGRAHVTVHRARSLTVSV